MDILLYDVLRIKICFFPKNKKIYKTEIRTQLKKSINVLSGLGQKKIYRGEPMLTTNICSLPATCYLLSLFYISEIQ